MTFIFTNNWALIALMILQLGLVFYFSARLNRMSFSTATAVFILYSAITGLTFSSIFVVFSMSSIATTFFITAGMFAAMALVGSFTKKDLSGMGKFALMALIGLIIAGIVNMFLRNAMMDFIVSGIGVLVFAGLTAYDSQKIRQMLQMQSEINESTQKLALFGSLSLYLDFINIFLYLLRFFGSSRYLFFREKRQFFQNIFSKKCSFFLEKYVLYTYLCLFNPHPQRQFCPSPQRWGRI